MANALHGSRRPLRSTRTHGLARAPWAWAVGGSLLGVIAALLLNAPASWLAWGVYKATGQRVVLDDVRGTIWNASAQLTLSGGPGSLDEKTMQGRLRWQALPILQGLRVSVQADCCMQQAWHVRLLPGWSGLRLSLADHSSNWPAELMTGLGTPWNTIQAQGSLRLRSQGLELQWAAGRLSVNGQLQLDAIDMSSRLSTLRPMGSYRLVLQGGGTPTLALSTLGGALQLSGQGQWVGERLRFNGQASASAGFESVLSNLLNIIGRRQGERSIIQLG